MRKFAIVTDSASDINRAAIERFGIRALWRCRSAALRRCVGRA